MNSKNTRQNQKQNAAGKKYSSAKANSAAKANSTAKNFVTDSTFKADPFGSYTGHSKDTDEKPVQDVDDL